MPITNFRPRPARLTCGHCGLPMRFLHGTDTQRVYGCTKGHILKQVTQKTVYRFPGNSDTPKGAA